jgi:hypothetical protein
MPTPFATIQDWQTWIDNNIVPNGNQDITGEDGNITENAAAQFIIQATVNWNLAKVHSTGGALVLSNGVTVVTGATPTSLSWGDNFYNEWYIVNLTPNILNLDSGIFYYNPTGSPQNAIPAQTSLHIAKSENGLWVQIGGASATGGGGGSQKEPATYIVGTTPNAPAQGATTWQLGIFANSYMLLFYGSTLLPLSDPGDGSMWFSKPLNSDTGTIANGQFYNGDILTYLLITP